MKAIPEADRPFLSVEREHPSRQPEPAVLVPDVIRRAHRIVGTGVVGLPLVDCAVPLGAHPGGQPAAARPHRRQHLEGGEARRQLGGDERVHRQVDEDLAEPEAGVTRSGGPPRSRSSTVPYGRHHHGTGADLAGAAPEERHP